MGARKREMAERLKEIKRHTAIAKLNDVPTSPRKMRLVADMIRGVEVNRALDILHYSKKEKYIRQYGIDSTWFDGWDDPDVVAQDSITNLRKPSEDSLTNNH